MTAKQCAADNAPNTPQLSVVVPFYNEQSVLLICLQRLRSVCDSLNMHCELIFVDDGSTDGGPILLAGQLRTHPALSLVRLSRNFGKEAAMTAGIAQAKGAAVLILDADLQDPPELIPAMVDVWQDGADVVLMHRRTRGSDSLFKRLSAHLFYRLLNGLSDQTIPADVGDFRLISRKAVDALQQLPERNRYMKGMFAWIGMETAILEYDRAPRAAGVSKWDYLALIGLAVEGITSFSTKPLRWAALMGFTAAMAGGLFGVWIIFKTLVLGDPQHGYPSMMAMMTFLGGVQLLTVGILGEYIGKTYLEAKQRPIYLVRDVITGSDSELDKNMSPRLHVGRSCS